MNPTITSMDNGRNCRELFKFCLHVGQNNAEAKDAPPPNDFTRVLLERFSDVRQEKHGSPHTWSEEHEKLAHVAWAVGFRSVRVRQLAMDADKGEDVF